MNYINYDSMFYDVNISDADLDIIVLSRDDKYDVEPIKDMTENDIDGLCSVMGIDLLEVELTGSLYGKGGFYD